jgi:2,3,4,5-tetrahydropyridine-2,6-dicarboxylate N-succinyltransferase
MPATVTDLEQLVIEATKQVDGLESSHRTAVEETIARLDRGEVRMAEKVDGEWCVNAWVQQAILLYFSKVSTFETLQAGPFEFHDRVPLKRDLAARGVRVLPGGIVRYGSYVEPGVVVAPSFVNIGAYVGSESLVDTWATVGSGAQIGRGVHLAGGVGIGGVLEPPGARPVIIEDGAFIGSRCIVVEGVIVEERAVLGAQVCLTASTHIVDVTQPEPVTYKGRVPAGSVVVPGTRKRSFPAGEFEVNCALIIGQRDESTDGKLQLNDELRDFSFAS